MGEEGGSCLQAANAPPGGTKTCRFKTNLSKNINPLVISDTQFGKKRQETLGCM